MSSSKTSTGNRLSTGLVALGSAAVFAVYSAGYLKTRAAAERLYDPRDLRRTAEPAVPVATSPSELGDETAESEAGTPVGAVAPEPRAGAARPVVMLALPTTPARPAGTPSERAVTSPVAPVDVAAVPPQTGAVVPLPNPVEPVLTQPAAAPPAQVTTASVASELSPTAAPQPAAKYKDGTYTGWGSGRHGDIQAQVVVVGGRITSAEISECLTRWSCSWVAPLPPQVIARQSGEVDYVTGATASTIAFYNAVAEALAKAK